MSELVNLPVEQLNSITEKIIGCVFEISYKLGVGFLEKVYENALIHELKKAGLSIEKQVQLKVRYEGVII